MKNDLKIKLSEYKYDKSLESLMDVYNNLSDLDILNIDFIDLRIPERAIIKFKDKTK